jgi:L-asparaginase
MVKNKKILIINTGGTFNKIYDELNGKLVIPKSSKNLKKLIQKAFKTKFKVKGIIYKDSLEFTKKDRKKLLKNIKLTRYLKIIIIHGTDTINKSAKYIAKRVKDKAILFIGSMMPASIDETEAIANLSLGIGFLNSKVKHNVYIAMHSKVKVHNKISKNRKLGIFKKNNF